jgi:cytochrome P450
MTAIAFNPMTPEQRENPFDVLELARREQPVFFAEAVGLWVVTRHDDVLAVLKDHRSFSSVGALKSSPAPYPPEVLEVLAGAYPEMPYIIEVDPPLHDRIRGLVTKAFTPRRIAELEPRIVEIAQELLDGFAQTAAPTSSSASPGLCRCGCSASSSACHARISSSCTIGARTGCSCNRSCRSSGASSTRVDS